MFARRAGTMLFIAFAAACSSATSSSPAEGSAPRSANVITAEELDDPAVSAGDALEAVRRLRPRFLVTRAAMSSRNSDAGAVHISIDGGSLVALDNLRNLRPSQIAEIRYLSASDAAQRFGTSSANGPVLLVKSR